MTPIEDFCGGNIWVINLERRKDRWEHFLAQMKSLGITSFRRFEAYDKPVDHLGNQNGNMGCTSSHRALYEIIAHEKPSKPVLIFEDDVAFAHGDPQRAFAEFAGEIPSDMAMLYLGGHYAEVPQRWVTPRLIRINRMLTTSSYFVTWQQARKMAPHISGIGPIDTLLGKWNVEDPCYICEPRLFVQYPNFSDLQERHASNHQMMLDRHHVSQLAPLV